MEQDRLKRINVVIVASYLIGSLLASLGFAFTDSSVLFLFESILGLIVYLCGVIAAYKNYKTTKHKTLLVLMIAGIVFILSLSALMIQNILL